MAKEKESVKFGGRLLQRIAEFVPGGVGKKIRRKVMEVLDPEPDKRFRLSPDHSKQLAAVQSAMKERITNDERILGFTLYGSHVKGYSRRDSDFDAYVFVDGSIVPSHLAGNLTQELQRKLEKNLGGSFRISLSIRVLSASALRNEIHAVDIEYLTPLFLLAVGNGLNYWRKSIIERMELQSDGEQLWSNLMNRVWEAENAGYSEDHAKKRKALYPISLSEARLKYIGQR